LKKYFITTVGFYSKRHPHHAGEMHERCVGYYDTFEKAEEAVLNNAGDIYECGYYSYVVIEAIGPGIYATDFNPIWYKAKWEGPTEESQLGKYKVKKVSTPGFAKNVCGWAIG